MDSNKIKLKMAQAYMIMQICVRVEESLNAWQLQMWHDKSPSESQERGFTVLLAALFHRTLVWSCP